MNSLAITPTAVKKLQDIETQSLKVLEEALKGKRDCDDTVTLAIKAQNMVTKNRAIATSREGMHLRLARMIAQDETQMRKYVAATYPKIKKIVGSKG
jgi:hypothetical protein